MTSAHDHDDQDDHEVPRLAQAIHPSPVAPCVTDPPDVGAHHFTHQSTRLS